MKFKLYYGWYIVAASAVLGALNSIIFVYGFSAFVDPILGSLGWTVTQLSLASSLRSLENGIFNPLWGNLSDRWPARRLMLMGVIGTAVGVFILSRTTNLLIYYAGFLVVGVWSSLAFSVLPPVVITRWFRHDIGKANGVYAMGAGIGGVMVPLLVEVIDKLHWQNTLLLASIVYLVIGIPISFVFKNRPEDMGLIPDGRIVDSSKSGKKNTNYNFSTTVKQALKMRAFWYISLVQLYQMAVVGTVSTFIITYLTNERMEREQAAMIVSLFTFISLFARIPLGMLADFLNKRLVLSSTIALFAIALFCFWRLNGESPFWLVLLFASTCGIALGSIIALRAPVQLEYFGTHNFGVIFGLTSIASTLGGFIAAPIAGRIFDQFHTYRPFWLGLAIFGVLLMLLILTLPNAKRRAVNENPIIKED